MIVHVPKKDGGYQKQIASPIKFSASQPVYKHIGPKLGADDNGNTSALGIKEQGNIR